MSNTTVVFARGASINIQIKSYIFVGKDLQQ
jgi:hypothetical protein